MMKFAWSRWLSTDLALAKDEIRLCGSSADLTPVKDEIRHSNRHERNETNCWSGAVKVRDCVSYIGTESNDPMNKDSACLNLYSPQ